MMPRISLAIDNCFASKRWTKPADWIKLIKDMGISLIEASADTECDPLYMGNDYIDDWIQEVKKYSAKYNIQIINLYSGHGTYSTLGLTHTSEQVRNRFRDEWIKKQAHTAKQLNAGLGFFAHAFDDSILQQPELFDEYLNILYDNLADIAKYANEINLSSVSVEQMYSPHQPPWTIRTAEKLLAEVYKRSNVPFYLTLDLGHMNGQKKFKRPSQDAIYSWVRRKRNGEDIKDIWFGPTCARNSLGNNGEMQVVQNIENAIQNYPYLFSEECDSQVGSWLRRLGCYSPIIHLQQSDGISSPHWPFSQEFNQKGIITAKDVLRDIAVSYESNDNDLMPPKCEHIVLTLEPFIGTAAINHDSLDDIYESIKYWRNYIPYDGIRLDEALSYK